jgi:large subunit ribosomal protein L35
MPKMKTHSASKKRFRKTASGLLKRAKAGRRHHAWAKSSKQVRQLRKNGYVCTAQEHNITVLLPYK